MKDVIAFIDKRLAKYNQMLGSFRVLEKEAISMGDKTLLKAGIMLAETAIEDLEAVKSML